jgi:hypothetical protein
MAQWHGLNEVHIDEEPSGDDNHDINPNNTSIKDDGDKNHARHLTIWKSALVPVGKLHQLVLQRSQMTTKHTNRHETPQIGDTRLQIERKYIYLKPQSRGVAITPE